MPDTTVHYATRPATVDIVLALAADVLAILTAGFLLKTLAPWRHQ